MHFRTRTQITPRTQHATERKETNETMYRLHFTVFLFRSTSLAQCVCVCFADFFLKQNFSFCLFHLFYPVSAWIRCRLNVCVLLCSTHYFYDSLSFLHSVRAAHTHTYTRVCIHRYTCARSLCKSLHTFLCVRNMYNSGLFAYKHRCICIVYCTDVWQQYLNSCLFLFLLFQCSLLAQLLTSAVADVTYIFVTEHHHHRTDTEMYTERCQLQDEVATHYIYTEKRICIYMQNTEHWVASIARVKRVRQNQHQYTSKLTHTYTHVHQWL